MEDLLGAVVDNGLGIGSFLALLYFIFTYVKDINTTMIKMSDTMIQIQITLSTLTDRIEKLEEKFKGNGD